MGLSDGDYSARERACIEALRKNFAELKVTRQEEDDLRWMALGPASGLAFDQYDNGAVVELVTRDFVSRVEDLVAQYGDSAEATKELETLMAVPKT